MEGCVHIRGRGCMPLYVGIQIQISGNSYLSQSMIDSVLIFLKIYFTFNYVYVRVSVCEYVHITTGACGGRMH